MPFLAVLQDRRHEVADAVDDPPHVDADHELPILDRHIREPHAVHRHAGVVAGDVQLAEIALGLGQRVQHRLFLGHVDPHRHHTLVGARKRVRRLFDRVLLDVGHHDIGARLGERGGDT